MSSVYSYLNPNLFLADLWEHSKLKNPKLSIRALAKSLGLNAHGPLHQMLIGNRAISKNLVPKIATFFSLPQDEAMYLDLLVKLSQTNDTKSVEYYTNSLKSLLPKRLQGAKLIVDFAFQKSPLNYFILVLAELAPLPYDWKVIQKRLVFNYSQEEIQSAIKILIESKMIEIKNKVIKRITKESIYSVQDTVNLAVRHYHKDLCTLAGLAIDKQELNEREYNAYTFNINQEKLPEIKKTIRKFLSSLIDKYEESGSKANATYHLNAHLFKIANKE